jgi:prepilin signal peptidase PulO-like enzyme (type II secretory pathway)
MGLGDVHLQAAVGAARGWKVALLAFFVAVFIALLWALASVVFRRFSKFFRKEIPFGPHLAAAAILFIVARGPVVSVIDGFYGGVVRLLQRAPGVGEAIDEKPGRSLPAQLAQPRDQR